MLRLLIPITVTALMWFAAATPAHSQGIFSGLQLLQQCADPVPGEDKMDALRNVSVWANCRGFVVGSAAMLSVASSKEYCPPAEMLDEQVVRVVMKWLEENPREMHQHAAVAVRQALTQAFPCQKIQPTSAKRASASKP